MVEIKAFLHQGCIVVLIALGNRQLGPGGIGLLLSLTPACLGFRSIDARQLLSLADTIAFAAYRQAAQFARDISFDHGRVHCLNHAVEGNAQGKLKGLGRQNSLGSQLYGQFQRRRAVDHGLLFYAAD